MGVGPPRGLGGRPRRGVVKRLLPVHGYGPLLAGRLLCLRLALVFGLWGGGGIVTQLYTRVNTFSM